MYPSRVHTPQCPPPRDALWVTIVGAAGCPIRASRFPCVGGAGELANRVAIFVDGAYLDYILKEEFGGVRVDFGALSSRMAGSSEIVRTHYYHCLPYQGNPPTPEESERYSSKRKFFQALDRLPRYTVRQGRLAFRGVDDQGRPRYEQKRVDILLGVDMVQLAAKGTIQEAILLAGDSDLIPAVTAAKSEGVVVKLFHGQSPHADLWQEADERTRITQGPIDEVLMRH